MSAPSLHIESTDSMIWRPALSDFVYLGAYAFLSDHFTCYIYGKYVDVVRLLPEELQIDIL